MPIPPILLSGPANFNVAPIQAPDVLEKAGALMRLRALAGQQQMQQQQVEGLQQENQLRSIQLNDANAASQAMHEWDGKDINDLPGLYLKHGASANAILSLKSGIVDQQSKLAALDEKTLANLKNKHDNIAGAMDNIASITDPQKAAEAFEALKNDPDFISNLDPAEKAQLPNLHYQGPEWAREMANAALAESQLVENSTKRQTAAAAETRAGAAAQTAQTGAQRLAGELDPNSPLYKPTDDYLNKRAAAGDQEAQALLDARAKQAGNVAGAQEAAKLPYAGPKAAAEAAAKQPYEIQLAKLRQGPEPVYAYDPTQKATILTTQGEAEAANMQGIRKVTETDISKDTQSARQLGDAQMNLSAYRMASRQMGDLSATDNSRIASIMADPKLRIGIFGTELPTNWLSTLSDSSYWKQLSPAAQDAMVGYIGARGSIIAYAKSISGTGRLTESQLQTELKNLPNPTVPSNVREAQFDRFQRNIDQASSGLPVLPGVDRPADIRNRIENAPRPQPAGPQGQFASPGGMPLTPGQQVIGQDRKLHTVAKVYGDGSYDVAGGGSDSGLAPLLGQR